MRHFAYDMCGGVFVHCARLASSAGLASPCSTPLGRGTWFGSLGVHFPQQHQVVKSYTPKSRNLSDTASHQHIMPHINPAESSNSSPSFPSHHLITTITTTTSTTTSVLPDSVAHSLLVSTRPPPLPSRPNTHWRWRDDCRDPAARRVGECCEPKSAAQVRVRPLPTMSLLDDETTLSSVAAIIDSYFPDFESLSRAAEVAEEVELKRAAVEKELAAVESELPGEMDSVATAAAAAVGRLDELDNERERPRAERDGPHARQRQPGGRNGDAARDAQAAERESDHPAGARDRRRPAGRGSSAAVPGGASARRHHRCRRLRRDRRRRRRQQRRRRHHAHRRRPTDACVARAPPHAAGVRRERAPVRTPRPRPRAAAKAVRAAPATARRRR